MHEAEKKIYNICKTTGMIQFLHRRFHYHPYDLKGFHMLWVNLHSLTHPRIFKVFALILSTCLSVCVPTGLVCISVLPPRRGSYYVEHGTGVSVGSMLVFWCKEGYQLVGHEKITCILHAGVPRWSSYLPVCESRAAIQLPFMERNVS